MTFEELSRFLDVEGFDESPSEIHGLLSGRIAGGERLAGEKFRGAMLESVDSDEELIDNALTALETFYKEIIATFEDTDFGFAPMLPPDGADLEERVEALADWCQCFLSGLGGAGLSDAAGLSEDAMDAVKDIAAIAQAGLEGEPGEEDESDLFELQEYVRVAALLIYAELNQPGLAAQARSLTIH